MRETKRTGKGKIKFSINRFIICLVFLIFHEASVARLTANTTFCNPFNNDSKFLHQPFLQACHTYPTIESVPSFSLYCSVVHLYGLTKMGWNRTERNLHCFNSKKLRQTKQIHLKILMSVRRPVSSRQLNVSYSQAHLFLVQHATFHTLNFYILPFNSVLYHWHVFFLWEATTFYYGLEMSRFTFNSRSI